MSIKLLNKKQKVWVHDKYFQSMISEKANTIHFWQFPKKVEKRKKNFKIEKDSTLTDMKKF